MAKKNEQVTLDQVAPMNEGDMPTPVEMVADAIKAPKKQMTTSPEGEEATGAPMIYAAISAVMNDVGAVSKGDTNNQQGFRYRGIDAVMNAIHPAMAKHKVFVAPEILEHTREDRTSKSGGATIYSICKIRFTFYTTDGSSVSATVIGEAMDFGDKSTNKCMSIAFKYALFQVFCIPTEMIDPDADTIEDGGQSNEQKNAEMVKNANSTKITAVEAATLKALMEKKGVKGDNYGNTPIADLTGELYTKALAQLNKMPDVAPKMEEVHEGLPFE